MEKYQRIAVKVAKMGLFSDIHNCGAPTVNNPVNLYCNRPDGLTIYIEEGLRGKNQWSVDYTYDPNVRMRSAMDTISGMGTQKAMFEVVQKIIDGEYRK